ncbi:MAG TPA: c-type cytochrome [Polyangiales bacterium]|nr:c-type cytochrome [Polyangiales bacterium]
MHQPIRLSAFALVALGTLACSKSEPPAPAPAPAPAAAPVQTAPAAPAEPLTAESVFKTRCATCHGEGGHGDGPAAAALNPKPRNYTDPEWQKTVTDDQLKKTIVGGGVAVGKSPLMVPNPDLAGNEEVLNGLIKIIRGFAPHT